MTDLDRRLEPRARRRSAGSVSPSTGCADVREPRLEVAAVLDAAQVPAGAVGARDELSLAQRLVGDDLALRSRPGRASRGRRRTASRISSSVDWRKALPESGRELRLLEPVVAPDEREHDRPVELRHRHRLRRRRRVDAEELGELVDRRDPRGRHLERLVELLRERRRPRHAAGDLEIRGVVAVLARDKRVLTRSRRRQVVDRLGPAHHPRLRLTA